MEKTAGRSELQNRLLPVTSAIIVLAATSALADSISVNFSLTGNDANSVDAGETAIVGTDAQDAAITSATNVPGTYWNNLLLRASGAGAPGTFTDNTQGGNSLTLQDDTGNNVATVTSVGTFYCNFSDATDGDRSTDGEAGLIQSFLNLNSSESILINGLSTWAPNGYRVIAFFEAGQLSRTMGVRATDGIADQIIWYADDTTAANDGDADEDGLVDWRQATANSSGAATLYGNYGVYSNVYAADTLTISGDSTGGRGALSGLQIISLGTNFPPVDAVPVTSGLELWLDGTDVDGDGRREGAAETGLQNAGSGFVYLRNWTDKSGNSDALYEPGAAPLFVAGGGAGATDVARFEGNNRMVVNGMTLGGDVTVIAVFKTDTGANQQIFNSNGSDAGGGNYILELDTNPRVSGRVYDGPSTYGGVTAPSAVDTVNPHLAAYVYAESSKGELGVDGALADENSATAVIPPVTADAAIGAHPSNANNFFDGDLYELLVYDRQLTAAELRAVGAYLSLKYGLPIDYSATLMSVNFYRSADIAATHLASTDTAGYVPAENWLNIDIGSSRSFAATTLQNTNGILTAVRIESTVTPGYAANNGVGDVTPDHRMMNGALYYDNGDGTDTGTITISGLAANGMPSKYWVLVYFETNANNRENTITAAGLNISGLDGAAYGGTFIKAVGPGVNANYMVFEGLESASFSIDTTATNGRGGIAGIQIMEAPSQGTLFLVR